MNIEKPSRCFGGKISSYSVSYVIMRLPNGGEIKTKKRLRLKSYNFSIRRLTSVGFSTNWVESLKGLEL
jgi:hypothetical protein